MIRGMYRTGVKMNIFLSSIKFKETSNNPDMLKRIP